MTSDEYELAVERIVGKNPETLARVIVDQSILLRQERDQLEYYKKLFATACGDYDRACDVLESLFAMVMGECPSLLEGHFLYDQIKEVLE